MILGAFGDSLFFGSDLLDIQDHDSVNWFFPSQLTYPAILAKQLNLQYYCTALPAQGNKVIADDIIRAVSQHKNSMLYVINWTWIDRFEYIGRARVSDDIGWESTLPNNSNTKSTFYYKNFYSDIDAKLSNLIIINTVLEILLVEKCKFIMTYMDNSLFDTEYNCSFSIKYLQNKIKPHMIDFENLNFLDWSRKHKYEISENWHPLEQAHQSAADYLLPTVNHLLHTKYPGGEINETI